MINYQYPAHTFARVLKRTCGLVGVGAALVLSQTATAA
jgi:hypothetical protein